MCPQLYRNQPAIPKNESSNINRTIPGTGTTVFPERLLSPLTLKIAQIAARITGSKIAEPQETGLLKDFHAHSPAE